jgi:tRNA(Ile)-lysidine synthase
MRYTAPSLYSRRTKKAGKKVPTVKTSESVKKVLDYIRAGKMVSRGERLVVAVSGGPDSVCLLYILAELREELGIALHVAHLDHQLRGGDSADDAAYVAGLARRLSLPATIEARDVKAYRRKHRLSVEEAAREVRYAFLAQVAGNIGATKVAVGHTADDHIETILMHLLRGSGTRGLRGLLPVSRWPSGRVGLTVVRPLLALRREEAAAYCRRRHFKLRTDTSNLSPRLFRNRVRRYLLPELRKYNPQIDQALLRTATIASDDLDFIDKEVDRLWKRVVRIVKGVVVIDKKGLIALLPALQRYLMRRAVASVLGSLKDIEADHIEEILKALEMPAGRVIGLPFGLSFTIEYDRYLLAKDSSSLCPFPSLGEEIPLNIPGKTHFPGWAVTAALLSPSDVKSGEAKSDIFSAYFDFTRTGSNLTVRSRRPGDRFQPLGMVSVKRLNRFMIDAWIPQSWRGRIPIVASPEQIIWIVGYRIDERVKVTNATLKVLRLEFCRD